MRLRACHPDPLHPVASPVAHTFAGFWTFLLFTARFKGRLVTACRQYLPQLLLLVLLANLADIDFFSGFHRSFTHSLLAAVFIPLAVSCVWRIAGSYWQSAALYFLAYSSHLLIDFFTGTKLGWNSTASGIPLLWPWAKEFGSPVILIVGVKHKDFPALFSVENLHSSLYELLVFGVFTVALVLLWTRFKRVSLQLGPQSNERIP